jgi:hypothetical protein
VTSANTRDTDARACRVAAVISVLLKRKSFRVRRMQHSSFLRVVDAVSMDKDFLHLTYTFARGIGWDAQCARQLVRRVNSVLRQSDSYLLQAEVRDCTKESLCEGSAL